jgi:predicted ATPase
MLVIAGAAASGKTTKLIEMSAETGYSIVTYSGRAAALVQKKAQKMSLSIPHPMDFGTFLRKEYDMGRVKGFLIDNADDIFKSLTNAPIGAITITVQE